MTRSDLCRFVWEDTDVHNCCQRGEHLQHRCGDDNCERLEPATARGGRRLRQKGPGVRDS